MGVKSPGSFEERPDAMQGAPILSLGLVLAIQALGPPTLLPPPTTPPPPSPPGSPDAAPVGPLPMTPSRVVMHLTIGEDGGVTGCDIKESSGNAAIDTATCRVAFKRVKYAARTDASPGTPLRIIDLPVRWQIKQ